MQADTHVIRLRGPWTFRPLVRYERLANGQIVESVDQLPPSGTAPLSSDWDSILGADFHGLIRFDRRFQRPSGLTGATQVWLAVDETPALAEVALNGTLLGSLGGSVTDPTTKESNGTARWEIQPLLDQQNLLSVTVRLPLLGADGSAGIGSEKRIVPRCLIGSIRLEIEELPEPRCG